MPESTPTNSMILAAQVMQVAAKAGLPVQEICAAAGVNPADLRNLDDRLPSIAYQRLLAEAARFAGDDLFWLRKVDMDLSAKMNPVWEYCFNAPDVREVQRRTEYSYRLLSDAFFPHHIKTEDGLLIRISSRRPGFHVSIHQVDWGLSQWHGTFQAIAGPALPLTEVRLVSTDQERLTAYRNFFSVLVLGGQPHNELVFNSEVLNLPAIRKNLDPDLDRTLMRLLQPMIEKLHREDPLKEAVYVAIQKQLIHGPPTLANIASQIGSSPRTLQRRLGEMRMTFTQLVDEARCYLAEYYLGQSSLNIIDIALLLGYSETTSLNKAFVKWHGVSPGQFRKSKLEGEGELQGAVD